MKKRVMYGLLSILVFSLMLYMASAADTANGTGSVDNAYKCLNTITNKPTDSLSLQESVFATIAMGRKENLSKNIDSFKSGSEWCWPKSGCTIKDTAQVAWAYKRQGSSNTEIVKWLSNHNGTSNDLIWYLEIDATNHSYSECTLKYDNVEKRISINDDMTISGNPGSCFAVSTSGYWLVFRENCFDKDIQITCNQDFVSTLLYQKKTGGTIYVMPETHSAVGLGSTTEKVSVRCFKQGSKCDYEGSLWSALVLQKENIDISGYLPYLVALADDNQKYFPSSFLYALTGSNDQYNNIVQSEIQGRSWKMIASPYDEFYDTSLALLALNKNTASIMDDVKNYLLSIQTNEGCWNNNNIRDTAFILFAGWPREGSTGTGTPATTPDCTSISTQSCEPYNDCISAPSGKVLSNFGGCGFKVCCSVKIQKPSCSNQSGLICNDNQDCNGNIADASDSSKCCIGSCVAKSASPTCENQFNGTCKSECGTNEQETTDGTCSTSTDVCCKTTTTPPGSSWLIWVLVILIILVVLAIIFRKKLVVYWYKYKGNAKSSPVVRPEVPQSPMGQQRAQPPAFRSTLSPRYAPATVQAPVRPPVSRPQPTTRPAPNSKDKEFEDTLKKLKEMSK